MTAPVTSPPAPAPQPPVSWVPNRKVVTQLTVNVLTWGVALAVTKAGLHESPATAGVVSAAVGIAAGAVAGYLVKEIPRIEADAVKDAPKGM